MNFILIVLIVLFVLFVLFIAYKLVQTKENYTRTPYKSKIYGSTTYGFWRKRRTPANYYSPWWMRFYNYPFVHTE